MKQNTNFYFLLLTAISLLLAHCHSVNSEPTEKRARTAGILYKLAKVETTGFSSVTKLPGQLAAYQEVSIFPKVNGYVKQVNVDIGSNVKKGQLLMMLEAPELEQSTMQAKEKYARTRADLSIDKEHYNRLQEAAQTAGAISPLDLSFVKAKVESDSAVCNAAKTNWQMQQTMEAYLKVIAPFSGVITDRNVHPGALVSAEARGAKPMLELKQIDHLRLQVDIPENMAGTMKEKDTLSFFTSSFPGKKITGTISRKSMNINTQFRSERIEADVMNKDALLTPGMYADVVIYAIGNANGFTVPKSSVVTSTERKYVLVARAGKINKVDVISGNESGDLVQVFGSLLNSDSVIVNGSDEIREGTIRPPVK